MDYYAFDRSGQACIDTHAPCCVCAGENALVHSEVFQRSGLTLYCSVPMEKLDQMVDRDDPLWANMDHADYLICKNDKALLAIALTCGAPSPPDNFYGSEAELDFDEFGEDEFEMDKPSDSSFRIRWDVSDEHGKKLLPCAEISETDMFHGQIGPLLRCLEQLTDQRDRVEFPCQVHLLTSDEYRRYTQLNKELLVPTLRGTYITEYGVRQGLFRARTRTGSCVFCIFPEDLEELESSQFRSGIRLSPATSFRQRTGRVLSGLPCSAMTAADEVQRFADMPLTEYLRDFPEELERFQALLGENARYQDAARYVATQMRAEQPGVCAFNGRPTEGKNLMMDLAAPVLATFPSPMKLMS